MVPDIITILDRETAETIVTERLKYGQRVKVVGASAPAPLRTPEALAVLGPAAFGLRRSLSPDRIAERMDRLNVRNRTEPRYGPRDRRAGP